MNFIKLNIHSQILNGLAIFIERKFILKNEPKIISVVTQKDGVSKITTAWNIGIGLVKSGYTILLLDFDPQGVLTTCLGCETCEELENKVSTLLLNKINNRESNLDDHILGNLKVLI